MVPSGRGTSNPEGAARTLPAGVNPLFSSSGVAYKRVPLLTAEQLAEVYSQADFIESWLKAVRDRVNSELNAGHPVPGFKLVTGKQSNRAWCDEEAARALLKDQFRYKTEEVFDLKLISPTKAEKLI